MSHDSYVARRGQLETYFDRTAADAWARLTSTAKVSRIRETVRAGRDRMRATLLSRLPDDLTGARVLDAGCGTGALAVEAARRGAEVVAIDLSPTLVKLAAERLPTDLGRGRIELHVGDMLDSRLGEFDHVVGMDSLIHYRAGDMVDAVQSLIARTRTSLQFTFAPRTPLLTVMHNVGKLFPRGDRAPAIEPVSESTLRRLIGTRPALTMWTIGQTTRIKSGFYTSQALELVRR
ncbi:MAG: magnesium protoporphyrin IX methyltransferase [Dokdonella sp.]|uniref:magnesium protoporphyrin IX methyltransferase n=1 Tax=Dokdonella sp. TaxID=2291710 RepID=UPI00326545D8